MALAGVLRQSTAVAVIIGPFVDSTDGNSEETALSITAATIRLSKNGGVSAAKSDATAATHDNAGFYRCNLNATDTNTVGELVLWTHPTGALVVRHDFQILEEAVYDALYAASAAGYASAAALATVQADTDNIQTRLPAALVGGKMDSVAEVVLGTDSITAAVLAADAVAEIQTGLATATALASVQADTDNLQGLCNAIMTDTSSQLPSAIAAVQSDTDNLQTRLPAALVGGKMDSTVTGLTATVNMADFFTVNSGQSYATAVPGSVVKETADSAGGGGGGGDGSGFTAIPWNPAWDAQVESEVADALLVYDPPTALELTNEINTVEAAIAALNNLSEAQAQSAAAAALMAYDGPTHLELIAEIDSVQADLAALPTAPTTAQIAAAVLTTVMSESYSAKGAPKTLAQALYEVGQLLQEVSVVGSTMTVGKLDGTATMTFALNDPVNPSSIVRVT